MTEHIKLTTKGIKKILNNYKYPQAVAEYIWNGFDAGASKVEIEFKTNAVGFFDQLIITDNGKGIPQNLLNDKFEPFFESEKVIEIKSNKHHSVTNGKNGVGRLTFFTFASSATWNTTYRDLEKKKTFQYDIKISASELENYSGREDKLNEVTSTDTGTKVIFEGIHTISREVFDSDVFPHLQREFCWFLELNKHKKFSIVINGKELTYEEIIGEKEESTLHHDQTGIDFHLTFIRWEELLPKEYSKFYFLNSKREEQWKDYTTLNNKGDRFYHSLYVRSSYFDNFDFEPKQNEKQEPLMGGKRSDDAYKYLELELSNYLRKKRRPFIKFIADKLVDEYEKEGVIPAFKNDVWEQFRKSELEEVIKGLYEVQPKIFSTLNIEQKKTFVGFLNLILESEARDRVLEIIKGVVSLDQEEIEHLSELLKYTTLSKLTKMANLLKERYVSIDRLRELVWNKDLGANEVNHVQKIVEANYWIFGEQYHLVTAAEPKFEEALRRYVYLLRGEDRLVNIEHPDKKGEMDIFICRWDKNLDSITNIVVELKSPVINLGEKELSQVKKYMRVILEQDEFNASNMEWEFILVGNDFDSTGYIQSEMENASHHGERYLVFKADRYKIYVKKWSEIIAEFECKHEFLNKELQLERKQLTTKYESAGQIIEATLSGPSESQPVLVPVKKTKKAKKAPKIKS